MHELCGTFLETNERGRWDLGDKMRKCKEITLAEAETLTGIRIVAERGDGTVTVSVSNPESVSRMMVSENDDVGSMIRLSRIEYLSAKSRGSIESLTAETGQHIMIEPFFKGNRMRILIYPPINPNDRNSSQ